MNIKHARKSIIAAILLVCALTVQAFAYSEKIPYLWGITREYQVKNGEDLYPIARKFNLAIEHIMFANGMTGIKTSPGQKLLIPTRRIPPSSQLVNGIVLNLAERGLYLYEKGRIVNFYPVAIGQTGKWMTPTGDYKIITKVKNPTWIPPEWAGQDEPVPAGPDNPLGDRWMGLDKPGYGIHATNVPVSIGLAASHGCIRMYPELARKLFDQVNVGTTVKIVYEPVKIGVDPKTGMVYMEAYPDVYKKTTSTIQFAKEKLAEYNLLPLVDEKRVEQICQRQRGIPEILLGADITVKVNEKKIDLSMSPISKDGKIWTTSEVLKHIGATTVWNGKEKTLDIFRKNKKVTLSVVKITGSPDPTSDETAYLWEGKTVIPLSTVLKQLEVNYYWLPEYKTILVYSGMDKKPPVVKKPAAKKPAVKPAATPSPKTTPKATPTPAATSTPVPEKTETPSPSPSPSVTVPSPDVSPTPAETPEEKQTPEATPGVSPSPETSPKGDPGIIDVQENKGK
ncbi:MAG: L,D-transpeptidase family protein [Firmicutes bacterium]|nr:L,D-transpeptidase family protein [Bacillota bacterium]